MYPELSLDDITHVCTTINNYFETHLTSIVVPNKTGTLHYLDILNDLQVKRIFYIDNTTIDTQRGNHAILNFNEFIIIISGSILLELRNKYNEVIYCKQLNKNDTYKIYSNTWINYTILEPNTTILVTCDKTFNESIIESDESKFFL